MAEVILKKLEEIDPITTLQLSKEFDVPHMKVVGDCKSLETRNLVKMTPHKIDSVSLTEEGAKYAKEGTPEKLVFDALLASETPLTVDQLKELLPPQVASIGLAQCLKQKAVLMNKAEKTLAVNTDKFSDETQSILLSLQNGETVDPKILSDLKKRQLTEPKQLTIFEVSKGDNFAQGLQEMHDDLTSEMLVTDSWKDKPFKPANFHAKGKPLHVGSTHRLSRVSRGFKEIFQAMNFEEMPTNQWVESSFWNFDSLFQPQAHPSRDSHDTFFVKSPATSDLSRVEPSYLQAVKEAHEMGGSTGSTGYQSEWLLLEAEKNILRTHTTASSAQMLYRLAGDFNAGKHVVLPKAYFSIDRVFRNESLDATHLAEFHQVEGLVADRNISISRLKGVLSTFYRQIGLTDLKYKPAFNPYTEPSMEIFGYHPGLGQWIEVGNSGIFRPEMLKPMGLPEGVGVMAWGLSLERPTMIKYGVDNIRDLFGSKAKFGHFST